MVSNLQHMLMLRTSTEVFLLRRNIPANRYPLSKRAAGVKEVAVEGRSGKTPLRFFVSSDGQRFPKFQRSSDCSAERYRKTYISERACYNTGEDQWLNRFKSHARMFEKLWLPHGYGGSGLQNGEHL